MVCNVPVSFKANEDRNQLGAWLDSDPKAEKYMITKDGKLKRYSRLITITKLTLLQYICSLIWALSQETLSSTFKAFFENLVRCHLKTSIHTRHTRLDQSGKSHDGKVIQ